jgi:uncharacterized Tic20 family protein
LFFLPAGVVAGVTRRDSQCLAHQSAVEAFNAQVTGTLALLAVGVPGVWSLIAQANNAQGSNWPTDTWFLTFLAVWATLLAVTVLVTIISMVGAWRAWHGQAWRCPLAIPFLRTGH